MKKIAAISLISVFLMSGCAVHNDETSIGKFGLAYKSNIQRKLDNQYYTEAEASLADAPRDKCTLSCAINGIHAAFHYLKKNYISGCVMTVPTG
ncbi:hypothetical protein AACK77_000653 [Escherichia coli]